MRLAKARISRTIAASAAVAIAATGLALVSATPAMAAETVCTPYTNAQVWQTSARWGRVRERLCLEYTSNTARGRVQFQVDYPNNCTISVGLPPSVSASCPGSVSVKSGNLDLVGTKMSVGIKLKSTIRWTNCTAGSWNGAGGTTMTRSCATPVFNAAQGRYIVYARDVMGDVKDDGGSWKVLAPVNWNFGTP